MAQQCSLSVFPDHVDSLELKCEGNNKVVIFFKYQGLNCDTAWCKKISPRQSRLTKIGGAAGRENNVFVQTSLPDRSLETSNTTIDVFELHKNLSINGFCGSTVVFYVRSDGGRKGGISNNDRRKKFLMRERGFNTLRRRERNNKGKGGHKVWKIKLGNSDVFLFIAFLSARMSET